MARAQHQLILAGNVHESLIKRAFPGGPTHHDLNAGTFITYGETGDLVPSSTPDGIVGVAVHPIDKTDRRVGYAVAGPADVIAGAPFPFGAWLTSDANGHAVPAKKGDHVRARAESHALRAGDIASCALVDFEKP